jgi:hypothetical protein
VKKRHDGEREDDRRQKEEKDEVEGALFTLEIELPGRSTRRISAGLP